MVVAGCGSDRDVAGFRVETEDVKEAPAAEADMPEAPKAAATVKVPAAASVPVAAKPGAAPKAFKRFNVYTDESAPDNHYFASGWMGDFADMEFDASCMESPHGGSTCIRINYSNDASQGAGWAGIYWQNPANNWGNRPGGYDLSGAKQLSFWARGENGGERVEEFKIGGITGEYFDSDVAGIGPVVLTKEWKQYVIDLEGRDLSSIIGGFAWAANLDHNPNGMVFYLDDIRYE